MKKLGSIVCIVVFLQGMIPVESHATELQTEETQPANVEEFVVEDTQLTEEVEVVQATTVQNTTMKQLQSRAGGIANVNDSASYIAAYTDPTVHTIVLDSNITITSSIPVMSARNLTIEGGGNVLDYKGFSSTITDGVPNAQIKLQNLTFSNNGVGMNAFPNYITAAGVTFIAENVTATGSHFADSVKGTIIFQGTININHPTASGGVANARKVIFDTNVRFTSKSSELVHFTNYEDAGIFSIEVRDGAELTVETRNSFMHTEADTQIIIGENAKVKATIGSTMSFNDNLDVIKIGRNSDFDISSNYTGSNRVLVFHELIELADSARFSLKGKGTGRLIWASMANAMINIGNDAEFVLENTGTALIDLTSPGTLIFPGQKVETWNKGSNTALAPTNTVEFTEANTTFAGTVVAVTAIDTDFANNFKPNAYSKVRISKKRRPAVTVLPTITYERATTKTPDNFLMDTNAQIDIQGVVTSDFATAVNMNVAGTYTVTISGVDRFNHVAPTQTTQVVVVDTTAPIMEYIQVNFELGSTVSEADFIVAAEITANEPVTYVTNFSQAVNLNQVGVYQVLVTATDSYNNSSSIIVDVYVNDTTPPVVIVDPTILANGVVYESGSIVSNEDFIIDSQVSSNELSMYATNFSQVVDLNQVGEYQVRITATDSYNNAGFIVVTVHVIDTTSPIIMVSPIVAANGVTYELRSTVSDNDFIIAAQVSSNEPVTYTTNFTQMVNLNQVGDYQVRITATDASGNTSSVTVIVHVKNIANTSISAPSKAPSNTVSKASVSNYPNTGDNSTISLTNMLLLASFSLFVFVVLSISIVYKKYNKELPRK